MPMLGVFVDLDVRVVRAQVTRSAGMRTAGLGDGKLVTAVTRVAVSGGAVGVDIAHAVVGPGVGSGAVVFIQLDLGAMALHAPRLVGRSAELRVALAFMNLGQGVKIVLGDDLVVGAKMPAGVELGFGLGVTPAAGIR